MSGPTGTTTSTVPARGVTLGPGPRALSYHCSACRLGPADARAHDGALRRCEVCSAWVAATSTLVGRDLDLLPHQRRPG